MAKAKRKRAPGGGRKPAGPIKTKRATFSTRITTETREALEAEAAALGQSISQVAEQYLKLAIQLARQKNLDDPIRALSYLINNLAYTCSFADDNEPGKPLDWTNDPFAFDAFARAVSMLLDRLRPSGEMSPPVGGGFENEQTPQAMAEYAVQATWRGLTSPPPVEVDPLSSAIAMHPLIGAITKRYAYANLDAARALGIGRKGTHK